MMKIYYLGRVINKKIEDIQLNTTKHTDFPVTLNAIKTGMQHSEDFNKLSEHKDPRSQDTIFYSYVKTNKYTGVALITDLPFDSFNPEDLHAFYMYVLNYKGSLQDLNEQLYIEGLRPSFLSQLNSLSDPLQEKIFSILKPLRKKIAQESNLSKKQAATAMLYSIEDALISFSKHQINQEQFKQRIDNAIRDARDVLGQQPGWKRLLDWILNAIVGLFSTSRYSLFAKPNPFEAEIAEIKHIINFHGEIKIL